MKSRWIGLALALAIALVLVALAKAQSAPVEGDFVVSLADEKKIRIQRIDSELRQLENERQELSIERFCVGKAKDRPGLKACARRP